MLQLATAQPVVDTARAWAEARQAAVEIFASASADSATRTAAWARLSEAERALLDAVKALTPEPQEPFDPKAHPLVGKRFRLKHERGMVREGLRDCWETRTAFAGAIGTVVGVWPIASEWKCSNPT